MRLIERLPWKKSVGHTTNDVGHGRHEIRRAKVLPISGTGLKSGELPWLDVSAAIRIDRVRNDADGTSRETAYFITDRSSDEGAALLGLACRAHWAIENRLHWIRDAVYREDSSLRYIANLPVIFSVCFSISIAVAARLGGSHADARLRLKYDRRLLGIMLGVSLV